jgi:peptidoglycan-associated lipoprotein
MEIHIKRVWVCAAAAALLLAAGCKKNTPLPPVAGNTPPPKPVTTTTPAPAPPKAVLAPAIDSFTVEPTRIERGQSATLRWAVSNATQISIDQGLGTVPASGSRQIFPGMTTTYTLNASSPAGMVTRSVTVDVVVPPPPSAPKTTPSTAVDPVTMIRQGSQDVYFDYDMSELREDARRALNVNADLLRRALAINPNLTVVIEGHCDERGSSEYNLGLGDRRANAARDYLIQLGVPANNLRTISFGEERPVCTDPNEACYQRNRRAHLEPAQ